MSIGPIEVKTPGKLMIAGEFSVLEPYQKLVVIAVDRFVYTEIKQTERNSLTLENFHLHNLKWSWNYNEKKVKIDKSDGRSRFVEAAMNVTLAYLNEKSIAIKPFSLSVRSELDDGAGKKYGLGSSAAVVTSVVSAILQLHLQEKTQKEVIFKLASIAHVITQGNGSGADVAASTYGGMLQYSSFQADWLIKEYKQAKMVSGVVEKDWTYCSIKQLEIPRDIHIAVGWTGNPASTSKLVKQILALKETATDKFTNFLTESEGAVSQFLEGIKKADPEQIYEGIHLNRKALVSIGEEANVELETPLLTQLCDIADAHGGAGKLSGAGGGDCGIAFIHSEAKKKEIELAWKQTGIQPLSLSVYFK